MRERRLGFALTCLALLGGIAGGFLAERHSAVGSRNPSGTYSLPSPQYPAASGTTIKAADRNTIDSDLASELTNSLDRAGRGCMTGDLQLLDGTKAAPGVTWCSETGSGLYRNALHDVRMSVNATDVQQWTSTASQFYQPVTVAAPSSGVALTVTGDGAGDNACSFTAGSATIAGQWYAGSFTGGNQGTSGNAGGRGVLVNGGTGNGAGAGGRAGAFVAGQGGATGAGGIGATFVGGAGGATSGAGGVGASGGGGAGTAGNGAGGDGLQGNGGAGNGSGAGGNGGTFTGGTSGSGAAGAGISATGGGTAAGGRFANGTAATGGTRQDDVVLVRGDLSLDGVANPTGATASGLASEPALKNRVTPVSVVKAYLNYGSGATGLANSSFSISNVTCSSNAVTVTFATAFSSTAANLCICTGTGVGTTGNTQMSCTSNSTTQSVIQGWGTTGTQINLCSASTFSCIWFGAQ